ncbi:23S rRNA (adenine(2030)-N(6))-methyltransferase RlmJ [Halomonas sp. NCCP-2165]|nr:23S rRNA (adenine(2030)-N(6))-methyltransferase RlmJ [Halomonas sp. NCCP-2165]GKW50046.1 ribosomal RNA large subunit methyltransferase J [Halomonas sp. NCCP-2165]
MLAYQHAYHAGNFADVHKHLLLVTLRDRLLRKESAITYVDTHAGRGHYPLHAEEARKLQEHREGVEPIWRARGVASGALKAWLAQLAEAQPGNDLTHYPGSPRWLSAGLRAQDRLSLFELHPGEFGHLERAGEDARVRRVHGDGLAGLKRLLPVATPRLCVLIDPSYELKEEYRDLVATLAWVGRKARHAVVAVWYPLLPAGRHQELLEGLKSTGLRKVWRSEVRLREPGAERHGMYGSGMLVLNPPWGLDQAVEEAMSQVTAIWGAPARHRADWWLPE